MEIIFIRHGHGEHLVNYPNQLNMQHPGLTGRGQSQVRELRKRMPVHPEDLVLVSPTKRTIETAQILCEDIKLYATPLVGPRMFPQHPDLPAFGCDEIYSKEVVIQRYPQIEMLESGMEWRTEGINRMDQGDFETCAKQLLDWCLGQTKRLIMISHDGTITSYRLLLGEKHLSRSDFLGEAGVYETTYR